MSAKLISHKICSEARERAHKLISDVRNHKSILGKYVFFCRPIGSQKRRCIIQDSNGKYDLDFQIVLTCNSPNGDDNPTAIKKAFLRAFTDCANTNEKVEDSTTVVTVRASKNNGKFDASKEKFSFDFVIINIDETLRIRRNGQNEYTWVQLPTRCSYIYEAFNNLSLEDQTNLLENHLLPRIVYEKSKQNESQRIPTIELFYQEVNKYVGVQEE